MDTLQEPPLHNSTVDGENDNIVNDEADTSTEVSVEPNVCRKPNGITEGIDADRPETEISETVPPSEDISTVSENTNIVKEKNETEILTDGLHISSILEAEESTTTEVVNNDNSEAETTITGEPEIVDKANNVVEITEANCASDETQLQDTTIEVDGIVEMCNDKVTFETEILVETNDNEINENELNKDTKEIETAHNILNELGQSIDLSEALGLSNVSENVENNNCELRQEVFNKEELLDILEGNNEEQSRNIISEKFHSGSKMLEAQLALQQLSRLKSSKPKKRRSMERLPRRKKNERKNLQDNRNRIEVLAEESKDTPNNTEVIEEKSNQSTAEVPIGESIVNVLVKDWEDEEPTEGKKTDKLVEETEDSLKTSEQHVESQEAVMKQELTTEQEPLNQSSAALSKSADQSPIVNKSSDETQPQKRLGRVIKKKVIFDPDNPDTFTKSKSVKNREPQNEKEQPPIKKIKVEQMSQRPKSKSPISKLQWKKPPPKNSRRLTEIDKLLMDEGAVNMICQLTPEAPKGKKNMKSKAEFIKKIQSSTPDTKEMKFRERKKEAKYEEGEAKKILGIKQRPSLSSSVKSPSVCEDFEATSADDSVIIRRHSSSSYSSSCMSPRRLSDVEAGISHSGTHTSHPDDSRNQSVTAANEVPSTDVFMSVDTSIQTNEFINKDDCLSIKEKLNSKLSLALNKRKRESTKVEKPAKPKKITKVDEEKSISNVETNFKNFTLNIDQHLAEICIRKSGSIYDIETIKELESALVYVESRNDISVTLLTSECGTLCAGIDLTPILNDNENWKSYAYDVAESVRSLLCSLECHSKLVCCAVEGRCSSVGAALAAVSDVSLASERASFALVEQLGEPLQPGAAALTAASRPLTHTLINDLVVFGRRVSASEALRGGLVSRILWPERFAERVREIAKDVAAQPKHNIMLKKQLLCLKKMGAESTFPSCLEKERDLLVEYWTSAEGQKLIRGSIDIAE